MEKKETSKIIEETIKPEERTIKCAVCDIKLQTHKFKKKTMKFENGLIKNFIRDSKVVEHHKSGLITGLDGSQIDLCIEHFNTAWTLKNANNSFKDIVEELKKNGGPVILNELDPALEEIKKELTESACNGNLEL